MIAVDTNLLIYAHREEAPHHDAAKSCLETLAERRWALPWPCVHEFLAIATHPRVFDPPSPLDDALLAVSGWLSAPTTEVLAARDGYWDVLDEVLREAGVVGPKIHDARIAALCMHHGVSELWTADRDFSRFPGVRTVNPIARQA